MRSGVRSQAPVSRPTEPPRDTPRTNRDRLLRNGRPRAGRPMVPSGPSPQSENPTMTQPISSPQATSRDSDLPGSDSGRAPAQTKSPRGRLQGRRRTILVGLLVVLSSLGVLLSTVGIWVRQTALNDDRWAALSARVVSDPEVQASVSRRLASQVVES